MNEQGKKKFVFESRPATRDFYIPNFEPLSKGFIKLVNDRKNDMDEYNKNLPEDKKSNDAIYLQMIVAIHISIIRCTTRFVRLAFKQRDLVGMGGVIERGNGGCIE